MGKQASKSAGGGWRTRRQRSQSMSEPTVVSSPEPPRLIAESTDRAILTLKLQRDELTVYKGRINTLLRKEEDTVKRLLTEGLTDRARLLLKKKRFQEHILQETETQLNAILNQANAQTELPELRQEVDQTIDRNSEAMKKLHILLSLENAEWMLKGTYEGSKKQSEINQLLQLATLAERDVLEKDVETEIQKLEVALGVASEDKGDAEVPTEENAIPDAIAKEDENELEALVVEKIKEKDLIGVTLTEPEMNEGALKEDEKEADVIITKKLEEKPAGNADAPHEAAANERQEAVTHKPKFMELLAQPTIESIDLAREDEIRKMINEDARVKLESQLELLDNTERKEFSKGSFDTEILSGTTVLPAITIEKIESYDDTVESTFSDVTTSGFTILNEKVWSSTNVSEAPLNQKSTEIVSLLPDVPTHSIDMNNEREVEVKEAPEKPDFIALADEDIL